MDAILTSERDRISAICVRHGVARLHVFGSAVRRSPRPEESDINLLVEFLPMEPYARVEAYFGLLEDLRKLLNAKIHLVMVGALKNPYIARSIEQTKKILYSA